MSSRSFRPYGVLKAHSAGSARAYGDPAKVAAVHADLDHTNIAEPLRATLRMPRNLKLDRSVVADDMRALLAAGVSTAQIKDALAVSFAFNTMNRLADAFGSSCLGPKPL